NSLLLLAQGLVQNRGGNLTEEQVESARIIHGSGCDLLSLINEILDLSKIEAGRVDLQLEQVRVSDLVEKIQDSFQALANEKDLALEIIVSVEAPPEITSDAKRIEQILRNLVSNAIKFTENGSVTVTFGPPSSGTDLTQSRLMAQGCLAIAIKDTGIGIAPELHKRIFEAFQQADGTTSRRYGGTGLGLSISKELTTLLGGEITVDSELDKGATFTLYLPQTIDRRNPTVPAPAAEPVHKKLPTVESLPPIPDDRNSIETTDRTMLVIEDDPDFARLLHQKCHEKAFKCLIATSGEAGLELAAQFKPSAIILDLRLPAMDGWEVLTALKENVLTRHIPVHIISVEEPSARALHRGAIGHFPKPIDQGKLEEVFHKLEQVSARKPKRLLVVDDDPVVRRATVKLVGNGDVTTDEAENGEKALVALRSNQYDCVVMDLGLPDMDGGELLTQLEREGFELPPVVIYTARDLTMDEEAAIRERAESIVIKDVRSQERLLDEVSLFLHRVVSRMSDKKRKIIEDLHDTDILLKDKKVLVVDDDMRTTFTVSHLLAERGMKP
ncbi:MAG: response regulator, partial [Desulfobulbus sp.]|nr:response regulator [Desulfobulbus sp.]